MKRASVDADGKISISPENTDIGKVERLLLSETETPAYEGYSRQEDIEAMTDMIQVLANRLKHPAKFEAPGAVTEAQVLVPSQFPEFLEYPEKLPKTVAESLEDANDPTDAQQFAYIQHVEDAIAAATGSIDSPVADLVDAMGWVKTPKTGEPDFGIADAYSLGNIGGNTFHGIHAPWAE